MEELTEEQVRDLITKIYCVRYTGTIKLTTLKTASGDIFGYKVSLGLGCDEKPLQIAFDGTAEEFMKLLEKRLRNDQLAKTEYSYGMKGYSYDDISANPHLKKI